MYMNDEDLHLETSETGARILTLQKGSKHFFYPQQFVKKDDGIVGRGGMHICSPVFGPAKGKGIFSEAPQHGELRDFFWTSNATSNISPTGICFWNKYTEWDSDLMYMVSYFLTKNKLDVYTSIKNHKSEPTPIELGWHPYFNAPYGGTIWFSDSKIPDINIYEAYGPKVFPACKNIVIGLNGIGTVRMELCDGFNKGHVCVWTDWRQKYFCVEPLLSYHNFNTKKGTILQPEENILAKFVMHFED